MAKYNTLTALFTAIANSLRSKTGSTGKIVADDFPSVIDSLSTGGITPTGTKTITTNGTHDVTSYASAQVNVQTGITPTGTKTITANGTHDVSSFANALVNVPGLNAKVFTVTIPSNVTSGTPGFITNDWLKSIRNDPDAFVFVRNMGVKASTAMFSFWFTSNFTLFYNGTTAYNSMLARTTASATNIINSTAGLKGENYSGHLNIDANGKLWLYANASYPLLAGTYQIVAGTMKML